MKKTGIPLLLFLSVFLMGFAFSSISNVTSRPFDAKLIKKLINTYRQKGQTCGDYQYPPAKELKWNKKLREAAKIHTKDMNRHRSLKHLGSQDETSADRLKKVGYAWQRHGENIAMGQRTEKRLIKEWMESEGHCKNIMNPKFTEMGFYKEGKYSTLILAEPAQ